MAKANNLGAVYNTHITNSAMLSLQGAKKPYGDTRPAMNCLFEAKSSIITVL